MPNGQCLSTLHYRYPSTDLYGRRPCRASGGGNEREINDLKID